jgi:hypothetical protein
MSGALIDFVEARLDTMHGARSELTVREAAPPPLTPNNIRKTIRTRHLPHDEHDAPKMVIPKSTESFNDGFGWLEEFVDVKMEVMKKQESLSLLLDSKSDESSSITTCTVPDKHRGHHHRRSLSRRESLGLEIKDSIDKNHRRSHSRRGSILDGLELNDDDKSLLNEAALAA